MSLNEVRVPDIGDTASVDVVEVLVSVGDTIAEGDALISLESDKSSMEVPSEFAGVVKEIKVAVGDQVGDGAVIAVIDSTGVEAASPAPQAEAPQAQAPEPAEREAPPQTEAPESKVRRIDPPPTQAQPPQPKPVLPEGEKPAHASPSIRKFARELGVDLHQVKGTGRKGRITREDVLTFVKAALKGPAKTGGAGLALPEMPVIDFSKFGEIENKPLTRIQKLSAAALHRSWLHVPHVTQLDEADITEMEQFRQAQKDEAKQAGYKLTPLVFMMKAVVAAMKAYPKFNSSLDPSGESLILKKYFHLGIAVDTPNGLVVPVVRDVDQKSLYTLAADLAELSGRARDGKLKPADIQGACFTISSLGGIGGTAFTPIVNAPEVAILGVSRSSMKPVWQNGEFVPRLMLPLCLSYDHRVIDGADAARFTTFLSRTLGDIRRLLL